MNQNSKKQITSPETKEEATRVAKSMQRPGQTKEQTRLIANGIQKGIEQYKKQHKAKSRELDKRLKLSQRQPSSKSEVESGPHIDYRQHWLPWGLLMLSWLSAGFYFFFQ
ncbi:MAG: hypothetical protein ACI9JR_001458 [Gammaproteobacteria bacterium]|jgi:hypothetical protein